MLEDDLLKYYRVPPEAAAVVSYTPISAEERKQRVAELNQKVKDNVTRIQNSEEFRKYLIAMSRFHNYSWGNQMLIWLQSPDATHVAGFNTWVDLGRRVKAGAKGIAILAPLAPTTATTWTRATDDAVRAIKRGDKGYSIYDDKENLVEAGFPSYAAAARKLKEMGFVEHREFIIASHFKVVHVFDISQTEGKELPQFEVPALTGEMNPQIFDSLLQLAKEEGITVSFEGKDADPRPSCKGYFKAPKFIWVRATEAPAQQLNVLSHELAHYFTEQVFRIPREDAETIADSAAYIVDAHYGFDSGQHSFAYVALWARDEKTLHKNLDTVQRVAEKMINLLEQKRTRDMAMKILPMTKYERVLRGGATLTEIEGFYPRADLERMARNAGIGTMAKTKRQLCQELINKGILRISPRR
jgi:hypothetical protein